MSDVPPQVSNATGAVSGSLVQAGTIHGGVHFHRVPAEIAKPRQLPLPPAHFTGRVPELEALSRAVGGRALVVITGAGGIGKTSLALRWLSQVPELGRDGQLFANLGAFDPSGPVRPADALGQFLRALGVAPEKVPASLAEQQALYRTMTADKSLAVLLDNASSADQVRQLLPGGTDGVVVVTSRRRLSALAADGARWVDAAPMDTETSLVLLSNVIGAERVAAEPDAAARIVAACAGLPIALAVIAARLVARPKWSLARVLGELENERTRLKGLSKHEDLSVSAVFDMSYSQLSDEAAQLYRRLSAHPGPQFSTDAAACLTTEAAEHALEELVDTNMLEEVREDRFQFHDLLRLHAAQRATEQETEQARRVCWEWYLVSAMAADRAATPNRRRLPHAFTSLGHKDFDGARDAVDWLEEERGNLRAVARQGVPEISWRVVDAMWPLFLHRRYNQDREELEELAVEAARACGDEVAEGRMLFQAGMGCKARGDHAKARRCFARAQAVNERTRDGWNTGNVEDGLGSACLADGDAGQAVEHFRRAAEVWGEVAGAERKVAISMLNLGRAHVAVDRAATALPLLIEAKARLTALGDVDPYHHARHDVFFAEAYLKDGQHELAEQHASKALSAMASLNSAFGQGLALEILSTLAQRTDPERAEELRGRALALFELVDAPDADRLR
ncbi:tetratricopeptide repeat protein [Allokutzneria multivorans]|uniref:tetratricopeptide repeat protein n=1 Tax=Allokutzneria multivorans TaxID=1142134 RepID=UPI0031E5ECAE